MVAINFVIGDLKYLWWNFALLKLFKMGHVVPFIDMDSPEWISNYIHFCEDEITYPFPNFNGCTVGVWEWTSNFIPHSTWHVITIHAGGKVIWVIEKSPWRASMSPLSGALRCCQVSGTRTSRWNIPPTKSFRTLALVQITQEASNSKGDVSATKWCRILNFCMIICCKVIW